MKKGKGSGEYSPLFVRVHGIYWDLFIQGRIQAKALVKISRAIMSAPDTTKKACGGLSFPSGGELSLHK